MGWLSFNCDRISQQKRILYVQVFSLSPVFSALIDLICMAVFCAMLYYETKWKTQGSQNKLHTALVALAIAFSIADLIHAVNYPAYPYIANLMRVIVILSFAK